jgi:hypothetical protein
VVLFIIYALGIAGLLFGTMKYLVTTDYFPFLGFCANILLYGVLSLLSFLAYRRETFFRGIFFQFWILFSFFALSGPAVLFVQKVYGQVPAVGAFVLSTIILHVLCAWVISKILFHYIFHDEKRWAINVLSSLVVFPLCCWLFWPLWFSPVSLLQLPTAVSAATIYLPIQRPAIIVDSVCLLMLLAFFLHKLRTDRPIGVFADTVLFLFGLYIAIDLVELIAQVNSLELMNITQWAYAVLAAAMAIALILRLHYKAQAIAEYYESQCLSNDPRVGRRIGFFDRLVLWCFFDPKKVGQRIFLGTGRTKVAVKRNSPRISQSGARE